MTSATIVRIIEASPDAVFSAFVEPDQAGAVVGAGRRACPVCRSRSARWRALQYPI